MKIDLRLARPDDYRFAFDLYATTLKPYASAWTAWVDEDQDAHFADLWRPADTRIIVLEGRTDVGWLEVRRTGPEIFLKQLYVAPAQQRQGIASRVLHRLLDESGGTARSVALFVLKNNPAVRFYERHGFVAVRETRTKFVMRREMIGNTRDERADSRPDFRA